MALFEKILAGELSINSDSKAKIFRLPLEVRTVIYDYVFETNILHYKRNYRYKELHKPKYYATWCIEARDSRCGYSHPTCDWLDRPKKQMLGLPLACRKMYVETIQRIYSRHTFHIRSDYIEDWSTITPRVHLSAIRSLRLTGISTPDSKDDESCSKIWQAVASLEQLKTLFVTVVFYETSDEWDQSNLEMLLNPIKQVQQRSLKQFDLVFSIYGTWFPEDCYLRIGYNGLRWESFLIDMEQFPTFQGLHPSCRAVGLNGFLHNYAVRKDMPTESELVKWFYHFPCHQAYGEDPPDGYDSDEQGEFVHPGEDWCRQRRDEGRELQSKLEKEYMDTDDPQKWDVLEIQRAADLMDQATNWRFKWQYPETPSWAQDD